MACCLTASSHYLDQCWSLICEIWWFPSEGNFTGNAQDIYLWHKFQNDLSKITAASPMDQLVKGEIVLFTRHLVMGSSPGDVTRNASMAQCKTAVSPLLTHWRYCGLALSYWYVHVFLSISRVVGVTVNTLRPRKNGHDFADDIFKCIFLSEIVWFSIKISLKFVPKGPILGRELGPSGVFPNQRFRWKLASSPLKHV